MATPTFRQALTASVLLALSHSFAWAQDNSTTTQPATAAPAQAGQPDPKLVVAKLDGVDITRQDIIESASGLDPQIRNNVDQFFPQLLDRYIFLKLVAAKGRADGLDKDPEVTKLVDDSVRQIEDNAIRQVFFKKLIEEKVTDAQVDAKYNELKAKFDDDVKKLPPEREISASHILVKTEDEAKAIIADLEKGGDFAKIAAEKSIDPSAKSNSGALGWFAKGMMVKEFEEAAFAMKDGEVSKAPVKSQFGYHVIKITGDRTKPLPTFDKSKEDVRLDLVEELRQQVAKDLKDAAKLDIVDPNGGLKPAQP
ncbi:peptidylprolyl isomerase [Dongia rigui]|uniref:Parvulin-like PPIase n=1 Tax=Dongia rigui TaxID=940149 RepID=A0ABU5DVA4_9PROT|nr:peptidylprolyl isomerase [Dongia rigui]MDY0871232.1 peptidylprolyl isomerase [Dongia rigui]